MPRGDRTGPMGMGPMTGRGAGHCNGFAEPGYTNPVGFARGFGCGFGRGRGHRNMFRATGMPEWARYGYAAYTGADTAAFDGKTFLSNQATLENQLQTGKEAAFQPGRRSQITSGYPCVMGKRHRYAPFPHK